MEKKETKLVKALRKDFKELYVKEYTTGWREQRFIRNIELGIMSLKNTEKYISEELDKAREEGREDTVRKIAQAIGYGAMAGETDGEILSRVQEELSKLRKLSKLRQ